MIRGWESKKGHPLGAEEAGMGRIMGGLENPQEGPEAVFRMLRYWTEQVSR